ncbi:MAG: DNA-methyltransferase [Candidatus Hodarchaeota archaeon]
MSIHKILYGDVWACLSTLNDNSIDCAITSPPYWSQRDYGFKGQIGNEKTLEEYLEKLITIFGLLRMKLKPKGVFYLNIGDKYLTKYGNTPLGMIPYILANYLVMDSWILEDLLIWQKLNHMPSSVKNRFTNTYEPIFVLSKEKLNYYCLFKQKNNISNILRIPLQPVPYKHMATFPEKLVECLLKRGLPDDALILDPFAGSGTTCKAIQNLSEGYFNPIKMSSIMIESFKDYIKIIKSRCRIKTSRISRVPFKKYSPTPLNSNFDVPISKTIDTSLNPFKLKRGKNIIKIFTDSNKFNTFLPLLYDGTLNSHLDDDGVLFLGLSDHNIHNMFKISQLNQNGWIIRNLLVVPQDTDWFPIFMLVKDIKSVRYKFDLDLIRIAHKHSQITDWNPQDFLGLRVEKPQNYFKNPESGVISTIVSHYESGLPKWVLVSWDKTKTKSLEEVIENSSLNNQIIMYCPECKSELYVFHHNKEKIACFSCKTQLWQDINNIPILEEKYPRLEPEYHFENNIRTKRDIKKRKYRGKFIDAEKINLGQSPGARVSVNEQYFTLQRYYKVKQSMICDYLNIHRKNVGLTKKGLTENFPAKYKHTCGHWLRKDMGGSLPKIEDLLKLEEILNLDATYVKYINRMGLKLQTVIAEKKGKNPGDFLDYPLETIIDMLKKVTT